MKWKKKVVYLNTLLARGYLQKLMPVKDWCWERLKAGGKGDDRGWGGWMASPIQQTWVWASSGSWWWTGKPDMLQSMGSQRVRQDWATELNWMPVMLIHLRSIMCWESIQSWTLFRSLRVVSPYIHSFPPLLSIPETLLWSSVERGSEVFPSSLF